MRSLHRIKRALSLVWVALREQVHAERAFPANMITEILSTGFYVLTFVIFLELLFQRTGAIAGFSKNDYLLMFLIGQLSFYIVYFGIFNTWARLIETVRSGAFDLLLLKPVPTRAFFYAGSLRPFSTLLTVLPNITFLVIIIDWQAIQFSWASFGMAMIVWSAGLVIYNTLLFALALPVFKTGDATDTLNIFYSLDSMPEVPYNKVPFAMKVASLMLIPGLLMTAATTDVMLMKSDPVPTLIASSIAGVVSFFIFGWLWHFALRNYTSASS